MGIQCSKRKAKPSEQFEIRTSQTQTSPQNQPTSKEALIYCDSSELATFMRTKPVKTFLADLMKKKQIQLDSCDQMAAIIESKSEIILRCYNDFTEKALKIKLKVLEYYNENYLRYKQQTHDQSTNQELLANETMQLLLETIIILNCLMDKNFDQDSELWWGDGYYDDRISVLSVSQDTSQQNDKIVQPIQQYLNALKNTIVQSIPIHEQQRVTEQPQSIANSTAIAQVHLTKFYHDLKLQFVRDVDEEKVDA
ncbi:unnamed protein product [Paramecium primaurelia]|uniref:Uncharacterized protein n=1 Tax=Paramecium primaurelia TaxID=5886 RepID=A0A8S1MUD3_PARPR|nr:unnamed protein product [Paramecium primaurelia]